MKSILLVLALGIAAAPAIRILTADLKPETLAGFDRYVKTAELRIGKEENDPAAFLYFDKLSAPDRNRIEGSLRQGTVFITKLTTLDSQGRPIEAPSGLIHHWLGMVFISRATLQEVLSIVQDYNHHQDYYKPEVIRSRLESRNDDHFKVYLRFQEKKLVTITLDTEHNVEYHRLDRTHEFSRSYSTRIQEVRDAGEPGEYLLPVGHDGGFLWRINSYWRFEESDGGVYVQCESISLTRDIPTGLGWLIEPFVTSVPRESLQETLEATRRAVK
jgi:hypothetical protein